MTDSERLGKIERQQIAILTALGDVLDTVKMSVDLLHELIEWANQPPASDLSEVITRLAAAVEATGERMIALPAEVSRQVVAAMQHSAGAK